MPLEGGVSGAEKRKLDHRGNDGARIGEAERHGAQRDAAAPARPAPPGRRQSPQRASWPPAQEQPGNAAAGQGHGRGAPGAEQGQR
jgi:hypothetical protein